MPKLTLSRSIALALLTLSLTACGTEETAATPAPELVPQELSVSPLVADGPPSVIGGTLVDRVFQSDDESRGEHCVSYRAALPPALKGMELRVAPVVPIISLTARPSCSGPVQAALTYSTDAWIWPRALRACHARRWKTCSAAWPARRTALAMPTRPCPSARTSRQHC